MSKSELLIYQGKDGLTRLSVKMEEETVWLNQNQLAELFQTTKQNVGQHIKNILADGELEASGTVKDSFTVAREGRRNVKRLVEHYNLDMIISVGYRVNSHVGVHFRRWATERLREYIIKGIPIKDLRPLATRLDPILMLAGERHPCKLPRHFPYADQDAFGLLFRWHLGTAHVL